MKKIKIDKMCDLTRKDLEKNYEQILEEVKAPKYICSKCARTATKKDYLCKSQKI